VGVFGRSYAHTCRSIHLGVAGSRMLLAASAAGATDDSAVLARRAFGIGWGVMSMVHRRGPVVLHLPRRMVVMWWASVTVRLVFVKVAVQSTSHSLPMLMRLFVKPGTMWPVRACAEGRACKASCAVSAEVCGTPVAVRMVMC
jgi:hypothetical protein